MRRLIALIPGTRLGPYEIELLLGAGGMGEVYRVRDSRLDRSVAIKVLSSSLTASPELKQRFERLRVQLLLFTRRPEYSPGAEEPECNHLFRQSPGFTVWRRFGTPNSVRYKGTSLTKPENLGEQVLHYGCAKKKRVKLYGKELELVSDPMNPDGEDIFIEAREKGSEHVRAVQVPRNVVEMAKGNRPTRKT